MKKVISEFKEFISRGNVMDMAVGIIIGGAFTNVVSSLVKDIINPILGLFGGMNFDRLSWNIIGDVTLNYGSFLTTVINFLIMAFVVFLIVKAMNTISSRFSRNKEEEKRKKNSGLYFFRKSALLIFRFCFSGEPMPTLHIKSGYFGLIC